MERIETHMHEIRKRFVRGLIMKLPPNELRSYVTGFADEDVIQTRGKAAA